MRAQGWEVRLSDYIESQKGQPFVWGKNDCVLFACHAADLIVDRDLTDEIIGYGDYDKAKAIEILKEHGGEISGIFDKHFKRGIKSMARRGDIAVVKHKDTKAAGIVVGRHVACKTVDGIVYVPASEILAVWRVE